jgi:hypothetical protein
MATLNEMIAQGAQFNVPDPVAQYNKLAQMQKYQQENELAKMQMEEYGRARQESNALRQFLPGLNESNRSQLLGYGAAGQGVYKTLAEGDTQQRLRDQARSQADLNESSILKNVVAQTRDAVAGIDPNDVESYAALRTSVLTQYPKLEPYMPAAWDANVKQRLITTAASVLEGQKPRPPVILRPGEMAIPANDPRLMGTGVTAPAAAAAAVKPPDKIAIMTALGYSLTPEGDAAYEAAKRAAPTVSAPTGTLAEMRATGIPETPEGLELYYRLKEKPPVVAPEAKTQEERNARAIALGAGPEGSDAFNAALRAEISRMTAKPAATVAASPPLTTEERNARAIALGAGPEGSFAYNQSLQAQLLRLTTKAEPVATAPAPTPEMKNADSFARLKGEPGTPAYNKEFAAQMARLTAKSSGGEGGGGAGGAAGTGTIKVVDPKNPTKTIIVTKERAVREGLTPAEAIEGLTPQMRQKLEASYPQATTSLKGHQNKTTLFIKDLEALRDSPGLDSVTGFAAGRAPGLTDAGRRTVALYDKVVAKGGFQSLQDMRDMSKTGGALGNVSDRENTQLKASFAAIDRKQNAADVRTALDDLIKELRGGLGRLQDAYDLTYEYKRGNAAPAAGGVDANNPLLRGK